MEQSAEMNRQILAEAVGGDEMLDDQGTASLALAHVAYEKNELDYAMQFAAQALGFAERRANESLQVEATIQMAYIHAAQNEFPQAEGSLKSINCQDQ